MDEIGYEVKKIEDDGRLQVEVLGGGYTQYFLDTLCWFTKKMEARLEACWNCRADGRNLDLSGP